MSDFDSKNEVYMAAALDEAGIRWDRPKRKSKVFVTKVLKEISWSPDFVIRDKVLGDVYIEVKGRLWTEARMAYQNFAKNGDCKNVIFVFQNGQSKITSRSSTTYVQWAERFGFVAFDTQNWAVSPNLQELILQLRERN